MKKKNKVYFLVFIIILVLIVLGYNLFKDDNNINTLEDDYNNSFTPSINYKEINWNSLEVYEIVLNNKSYEIKEEGIYKISGNINDGNVLINTKDNVKLVLDNVNINNSNGPGIIVENADNVIIELVANTFNTIVDGSSYDNEEYDGAIYSSDDLILMGNGTLKITSNYLDGIVSKDDLVIENGIYIIDSIDDGIRGTDSVYIENGNFTITSGGDGIKSTNEKDTSKGYVNIENGIFRIEADQDGISAITKLIIENGQFDIKTSSGSESSNSAISKFFGGSSSYDEISTKGFKAGDNLLIKNGTIQINSKDDAIHSNNSLGIYNGKLTISSGDDGVHADSDILINSGLIVIDNSYEGIEASNITINNGNISIISNDDGINISGGNDASSVNDRPGANNFSSTSGILTINGGIIHVDALGDGIDANGSVLINDGEVYVDGPIDNGNGALDYDKSFDINGGSLIAVGSSGMAQGLSESSKQYSLMFYLNNNYDGEKFSLVDEDENIICEYNATKRFQSVIISTPDIIKGKVYALKINNEEIDSITVSNITNSNSMFGDMFSGGHGGGGHQPPGRR